MSQRKEQHVDLAFVAENAELLQVVLLARQLKASLKAFAIAALPQVTGQECVWGKHLDVVCSHLEAVFHRKIGRLLVNLPPSTGKSTITNVIFPAWCWANDPSRRFLYYSYIQSLTVRDSVLTRELIGSDWYRSLFPDVNVSVGNDEKLFFKLDGGGWRRSSSPLALGTGEHPDVIVIDDVCSRDEINSPAIRDAISAWYRETLSTRGMGRGAAHVVSQQRLHVSDLSGCILDDHHRLIRDHGPEASPWHHVMLPMRFDSDRRMPDRGFGGDWRSNDGELLFPELLNERIVTATERALGISATRSQMQQDPRRSDSGMFAVAKITMVPTAEHSDRIVRAWDLAASQDRGSFTVGVKMGMRQTSVGKKFTVLDVVRKQTSDPMSLMHATALIDSIHHPGTRIVFEQQPGAAGVLLGKSIIERLRGFPAKGIRPTGDKVTRAEAFSSSVAYGDVSVVDGPFVSQYLDELELFPSAVMDQVDASSLAFLALMDPSSCSKRQSVIGGYSHDDDVKRIDVDAKCIACYRPRHNNQLHCCPGCQSGGEHTLECNLRATDFFNSRSD